MKSAKRVLDVLELAAINPGGLTIAQMAKQLHLPGSTVHALAHYLAARGYLQHPQATFSLGVKLLELGGAYAASLDLSKVFTQVARRIVAECGETVQMAVLDGMEVIYIAKEDGTHPVRLASFVGRRLPAHSTALGKALLAVLNDESVERAYGHICELPASTPKTIRSTNALLDELRATRLRGFACDYEEMTEGVQCLAAPILDVSATAVAALSISLLSVRATPERMLDLSDLLIWGAKDISARLGLKGLWAPYGHGGFSA